jgi:DNA repair exonuclease SbcCD ATPase subunit
MSLTSAKTGGHFIDDLLSYVSIYKSELIYKLTKLITKMDITLQGFRSCVNGTYRIEPHGVTLIQGPSGIGKSTIMAAVQWVLYGNLRKVYDNTGVTKKCNVTLSLDDLFVVYRQKKPDLFKVTMDGKSYEDEVAEGIILKQFGSEMFWKSSSYLAIDNPNPLLCSSQKEKMKILNEIALTDEDPEEYKNVVQGHIDTNKRGFDQKKVLLAQSETELALYLENNPVDDEIVCVDETTANKRILDAQKGYKDRADELKASQEARTRYKYITERIIQMRTTRDKLGVYADVDDMTKNAQDLKEMIETQAILEQYQPDINALTKQLASFSIEKKDKGRTVTEEDLLNVREKISNYIKGQDVCNQYNIDYTVKALTKRKNELTKLIQNQPMIKVRQQAREKVLAIDENLEELADGPEWTKEEIEDLKQEWRDYRQTKEVCIKYGLPHKKKAVQDRIKFLKKLVKDQPQIKAYQQYVKLEATAKSLHQKKVTQEQLMDAFNQLKESKERMKQGKPLQCPKCSSDVVLINGIIVLLSKSKPVTTAQLTKLTTKYDTLLKSFDEYQQYTSIKATMEELNIDDDYEGAELIEDLTPYNEELYTFTQMTYQGKPVQSIEDVEELSERIKLEKEREIIMRSANLSENDLEEEDDIMDIVSLKDELANITSIDVLKRPKEDIGYLQMIREYQQIEVKLKDIEGRIKKIPRGLRSVVEMKKELKGIEMSLAQKTQKNQQIANMDETIASYKEELTQLDIPGDLNEDLPAYQEKIEGAILSLEHTKRSMYVNERRKGIECIGNEIKAFHEKLTSLKELKEICEKIECETLQSTTDSINETLLQVTDAMFDDPISISLHLTKPLKSKDITRTTVNFNIRLKGGEFDSVNEMSHGERNRVNLAVTIAMARISSIPFVMLDECVCSLDADMRERCVSVLRTMLSHKTVVDIEHFVVEGLFSHVITMG